MFSDPHCSCILDCTVHRKTTSCVEGFPIMCPNIWWPQGRLNTVSLPSETISVMLRLLADCYNIWWLDTTFEIDLFRSISISLLQYAWVPSKVSFGSFSFVSSCKDGTMRIKNPSGIPPLDAEFIGKETKWWTCYEVLSLYMGGSQSLQPLFQHQFLWGTGISAIHIIVNWHAIVNFVGSSSQSRNSKNLHGNDFGDFVSFSSPIALKKPCPSLLLFLSWPSCPSFPWNFLGRTKTSTPRKAAIMWEQYD